MEKFVLVFLFFCFSLTAEAQKIIEYPEVAEQSHRELSIVKISLYTDSAVLTLTIENKLDNGGWFCADKNIYMEDLKDHKRYNLIHSTGIPTCPAVHHFKTAGEKLNFTLVFRGIPSGTRLLNLIEDCNDACFRFTGIILDEKLNFDIKQYNLGTDRYALKKTKEAIECFKKVVEVLPEFPTHVYGYAFYNLIKIYVSEGDKKNAKFWYDQLVKSNLPDKQYFTDSLIKDGIQLE